MASQVYKLIGEFCEDIAKCTVNATPDKRKWKWGRDDQDNVWMFYNSLAAFKIPDNCQIVCCSTLYDFMSPYSMGKMAHIPPEAVEVFADVQMTHPKDPKTELMRFKNRAGDEGYMDLKLWKLCQKFMDFYHQICFNKGMFYIDNAGVCEAIICGVKLNTKEAKDDEP